MNAGGAQFVDLSKARLPVKTDLSFGAAVADFDNDGRLDITISNVQARSLKK